MKPIFAASARRAAPAVIAFTLAWALSPGGPALARGQEPASEQGGASVMYIEESHSTTGEFARKMDRIVWARCLSVEVRAVQPSWVKTYYEFEVLEVVKGTFPNGRRPAARFVVAHVGGEVGNSSTRTIPPYPKLVPGDEVVLIAGRAADDGKVLISPTKSIYRVQADSQGRKTVTPHPTGMTLYRAANGQAYERKPGLVAVEDFLFSLRKLDGDDGGAAE